MTSLAEAAKAAAASLTKMKKDLELSYQDTIVDIGGSLIFFTPIKTGLASSNWMVSNSGALGAERTVVEGEKGLASLRGIQSEVVNLELGKVAIFGNPVDYIDDLEGGSSQMQAPAGMVTPTVPRINRLWLTNLEKYKLI